ncbi:MAG TPA: NAD(P)-dependent oxidoreductase [Geminicoccaceae bacterium]|nr:NAD(P)-dependent oxidoreductase [Geminicoccaceae bacterium]
MDTVLVTGGLGFTGRHIIQRLTSAGYHAVSYNRDFATSDDDAVTFAQGELFDVSRLTRVLRENGVSAVVHTAALSHPTLSLDFPVATFVANVDGTLGVLEAMRLAGVTRLVNFSSETVYGAVEGPVTEDTPANPSTPYAVSKVTTEWLGQVYQARYGLEAVSLRIGQVYGPGNRMPEILGDLLKAVTKTGSASLPRGRDHAFNFIHAFDVGRATECALAARGPFQLRGYNVSSAEHWRVSDVVDLMRKLVPSADVEVGPGLIPELDVQGPFDCSAARRDLGYAPKWPLERGLAQYAQWLSSHDA